MKSLKILGIGLAGAAIGAGLLASYLMVYYKGYQFKEEELRKDHHKRVIGFDSKPKEFTTKEPIGFVKNY